MNDATGLAVKKMINSDVPVASRVLARAFHRDPLISWILPDDARRERSMPHGFETMIKGVYLPKDQIYVTADLSSAALWAPPGKWRVPASVQMRLLPGLARTFGTRLPAFLKALTILDSNHPDEVPHWYLAVLGSDPDLQGRGLGSLAMRPVLDRCDREATPAYLESTNPANVGFYERRGFRIIKEIQVPGGPLVHGMWRDPS